VDLFAAMSRWNDDGVKIGYVLVLLLYICRLSCIFLLC